MGKQRQFKMIRRVASELPVIAIKSTFMGDKISGKELLKRGIEKRQDRRANHCRRVLRAIQSQSS